MYNNNKIPLFMKNRKLKALSSVNRTPYIIYIIIMTIIFFQ